jgi:peptidoglycan/LPS O-acetylase OafA/YrhL
MQADRQFESMPDTIPLPPIERAVSVLTAILALGALAVLACAARWRLAREMRGIALVVVVAIVVNDVICAWLSGPFARYGTRVIWLLPLVALLTVCAEWSKDRGAGA